MQKQVVLWETTAAELPLKREMRRAFSRAVAPMIGLALLATVPAQAAEVTYNDSSDNDKLTTGIAGVPNGSLVAKDSSDKLLDKGNTVIVKDQTVTGHISGSVVGGAAIAVDKDTAVSTSGNQVNVTLQTDANIIGDSTSTNTGNIVGGYSLNDKADASAAASSTHNTVTLKSGTLKAVNNDPNSGSLVGGFAMVGANDATATATAADNRVYLTGGSVERTLVGGYASNRGKGVSMAEANQVTITGGKVAPASASAPSPSMDGFVLGGYSFSAQSTATAKANRVTLEKGEVTAIAGGYSVNIGTDKEHHATATGNTVVINGKIDESVVGGQVVGGYSQTEKGTATSSDNRVSFTGGKVVGTSGNLEDGVVVGGVAMSGSGATNANHNQVTLTGGTVQRKVAGGYSLSSGDASAMSNVVDVSGTVKVGEGSIGGGEFGVVMGGFAGSTTGQATAAGNTVKFDGGTVATGLRGGYSYVHAGAKESRAVDNTVIITGGKLGDTNTKIYGGYSSVGSSATGARVARDNQVVVTGGEIVGEVYGGYASGTAAGSKVEVINNIVTISGAPKLEGANLYGGGSERTLVSGDDVFSGNTLRVQTTGVTVKSVQNFQKFEFVLPAGVKDGDTALTVKNDVNSEVITLGDGTKASYVSSVKFAGGGQALRSGDTINLLSGKVVQSNTKFNETTLQAQKGAVLDYTLAITQTADKGVIATVAKVGTNEQSKALSEGFLSGMTLVNQGGDLIAGAGMTDAVTASRQSKSGLAVFGALSGDKSRYDTGSHIKTSGISMLTGLAGGNDVAAGRLTLGAFFEYGNGSYDTYNSFASAASVHGDGKTRRTGGGVLGRLDLANQGYLEASIRAGRIHNNYTNNDVKDIQGIGAAYSTSSAYTGLHAGGGYVVSTGSGSLDVYGKYFYTRQNGASVTLATGDTVQFERATSSRVRVGGRYRFDAANPVSPYAGLALEHEFDGKANASTYGHAISAPSLKGGSGIAEAGLSVQPSPRRPLTLDVGVQAYAGKREGFAGSVRARYDF